VSFIGRAAKRADDLRRGLASAAKYAGRYASRAVPAPVKKRVAAYRNKKYPLSRELRHAPGLTYTLVAGVNGAGKTTLYRILNKYEDLGVRVNIDEMVASEGSWRDDMLQIAASRKALKVIGECIEKKRSFNQETTLPTATIVRQIRKAREAGYQIRLYFVGVENYQTAIKRVRSRVEKGGHGIDEKLIRQRFERLPETLHDVLPLVDSAFFYDNTVKFIQVAHVRNNVIVDCENDIPVWFWELIAKSRAESE